MNKAQAATTLEDFIIRIEKLCDLIDYDLDDIAIKQVYSNIKTDIQKLVTSLHKSSSTNSAENTIRNYVFPAFNEALIELNIPKGQKPSIEMIQCLYSARDQLLHYHQQLKLDAKS